MSLPILAVALLVVAGLSVSLTAAYFELRPHASGAGSMSVTDDLGRTVAVPASPHRLVVLSPNILDTVVRLGLRGDVVGVDCSSPTYGGISGDYSDRQIHDWNLSNGLCVQVSPAFNVEQLIHDAPDLVLASTIISLSDIEEVSTTYRIPVVVLAPATVGGILVDVQTVATIYGAGHLAGPLVAQLQTELANASRLVGAMAANGSPFPTVLLTYYVFPTGSTSPGYYTFGPGTFGQSLIELAGGASVSANSTVAYPLLSGPQVLFGNPSVIIYGTGFGLDLTSYEAGPNWAQFNAVARGHAYAIDANLVTEAGPTMILVGLPTLVGDLHPGH